MTISLKANAAGTQGEVLLNGTTVQTFNQNTLQVSGNVLAGAAQSSDPAALTRRDYVDSTFAKLSQFTGPLQPFGHFRFPGGLLICWGTVTPDASGNVGVSWNRAFGETPYAVVCRPQVFAGNALIGANEEFTAVANNITASGCQMSARYNSIGTGIVPSVYPIQYLAVGKDST